MALISYRNLTVSFGGPLYYWSHLVTVGQPKRRNRDMGHHRITKSVIGFLMLLLVPAASFGEPEARQLFGG